MTIDTWAPEPFYPKVCWKYALKAFDWARKYGIRILLDLHATPGSQNGYDKFYCMHRLVLTSLVFVQVQP